MAKRKKSLDTDSITVHYPDLQIPFHDPQALALVNRVVGEIKPFRIRQKGDMIDCYKKSRFEQDPDHAMEVEDECDLAYEVWNEWAGLSPGCELEWEEGNHEKRWERMRRRKGIKQRSIRTIPELVIQGKDDLDIKWIHEEMQPVMVGHYLSQHGSVVREHSAYTAKAHLLKAWHNIIIAHTHRIGTHAFTSQAGIHYFAHECGCLCNYDAEYIVGHPNWQQAFAIQYHYGTHDDFQVYPIHKLGKSYYVTVNGELYSV
jgi:hypothetical protein